MAKTADNYKAIVGIIFALLILGLVFVFVSSAPKEIPTQTEGQAGGKVSVTISKPNETTGTETAPETTTVTGHPQLKITSFNSRPVSPKINDVVALSVYVKNVGDASPATTMEFFVNDISIGTGNLKSLEKNVVGLVTTSWTVPAKGDYVIKAKVTPVAGEIFTDDNEDKLTLIVT